MTCVTSKAQQMTSEKVGQMHKSVTKWVDISKMNITQPRQAVCLETGTISIRRADVQQGCCSSKALQGLVMLTASL